MGCNPSKDGGIVGGASSAATAAAATAADSVRSSNAAASRGAETFLIPLQSDGKCDGNIVTQSISLISLLISSFGFLFFVFFFYAHDASKSVFNDQKVNGTTRRGRIRFQDENKIDFAWKKTAVFFFHFLPPRLT